MRSDSLECKQLHQVTQSADLHGLPENAVVLESLSLTAQPEGVLLVLTFPDRAKQYHAVGTSFGQDLQAAAQCEPKDARCVLQGKACMPYIKHCTASVCMRFKVSLHSRSANVFHIMYSASDGCATVMSCVIQDKLSCVLCIRLLQVLWRYLSPQMHVCLWKLL